MIGYISLVCITLSITKTELRKLNHVLGFFKFFFFKLFDAVDGVDDRDEAAAEIGVEVRLGLDDV